MTTTYRAQELAQAAGISVAVLRSYQSKGLLPPPRHRGRVAEYGSHHLERLRRIVELKARGHSLASIGEQLDTPVGLRLDEPGNEGLRLRDVAEQSGVPIEMLRSLEASGVLRPRRGDDGPLYGTADVRVVGCMLLLVGSGIPMDRFLEVVERHIESSKATADDAVELFRRFVEEPLRASVGGGEEQAELRVAQALEAMAAAIGELAAYLIERQVLASPVLDADLTGSLDGAVS
jgi:DNA-binding transcriptional MerR regulator